MLTRHIFFFFFSLLRYYSRRLIAILFSPLMFLRDYATLRLSPRLCSRHLLRRDCRHYYAISLMFAILDAITLAVDITPFCCHAYFHITPPSPLATPFLLTRHYYRPPLNTDVIASISMPLAGTPRRHAGGFIAANRLIRHYEPAASDTDASRHAAYITLLRRIRQMNASIRRH